MNAENMLVSIVHIRQLPKEVTYTCRVELQEREISIYFMGRLRHFSGQALRLGGRAPCLEQALSVL